MDYIITQENLNQLMQIDARLAVIEVRGDSVEHLLTCRLSLKRIVESLKQVDESKNIEKEIKEE
jgi:hypothetical protein